MKGTIKEYLYSAHVDRFCVERFLNRTYGFCMNSGSSCPILISHDLKSSSREKKSHSTVTPYNLRNLVTLKLLFVPNWFLAYICCYCFRYKLNYFFCFASRYTKLMEKIQDNHSLSVTDVVIVSRRLFSNQIKVNTFAPQYIMELIPIHIPIHTKSCDGVRFDRAFSLICTVHIETTACQFQEDMEHSSFKLV